jgi:hypothetical protein
LTQYKKCTQHNNEQLRNARNLEEVVKIKVQAIDGRLGDDQRNQNYDFKFDPIHFKQKVPLMGDRNFLINQAVLSSSSQTRKLNFGSRGNMTTGGGNNIGVLSPPFTGDGSRQMFSAGLPDERLFSAD